MVKKTEVTKVSIHKSWTSFPIFWLPFFFFVLGPMLAGSTFSTAGLSVLVAATTAIVGLIGEVFMLNRGLKGFYKYVAVLGIICCSLLFLYALLAYSFYLDR